MQISATIVLIIFGIYYVNRFLGGVLNSFGIWPRHPRGLAGILFSPLLHYNDAHLSTNMVSCFCIHWTRSGWYPDLSTNFVEGNWWRIRCMISGK